MKHLQLLILLFVFQIIPVLTYADNKEKTIESKIEKVTIFFDGAQITRTCTFQPETGTNKLLIKGLSPLIDPRSIQVKTDAGITIMSVEFRFNYMEINKDNEEVTALLQKQKELARELSRQNSMMDVYTQEEGLLKQNQSLRGENTGVQVAEIKAAADFYRLRLTDIKQKEFELSGVLRDLNEQISKVNDQIGQVKGRKEDASGEILVTVSAKSVKASELSILYFVGGAGWDPVYDIRANDISQDMKLVRKADVHQNTGEKWDNVKLTLSTGTPAKTNTKPILSTWYLGSQPPYVQESGESVTLNYAGALKGRVLDKQNRQAIPFANIVLENNGNQIAGTTSDFDGHYTIKPISQGRVDLKVSYVGYHAVMMKGIVINPGKITFLDLEMEATSVSLDAVEIRDYKVPLISKDMTSTGGTITADEIHHQPSASASSNNWSATSRGARTEGTAMYVDGRLVQAGTSAGEDMRLSGTPQQSNFEYEIETPYTIPDDGKNFSVTIGELSVPATYEYQCIPKLDKSAFLVARITRWEEYQLVSGEVNLYFEGTYTGKTRLDVNTTKDTLELSLGRDPSIMIQRTRVLDKSSSRIFGSSRKTERSWEISIRNNKRQPVTLLVEDQYPVSNNGDIKVELDESGDARVEEKTGKLSWKLKLDPAQTKKLNFRYTVKAPSDRTLWFE